MYVRRFLISFTIVISVVSSLISLSAVAKPNIIVILDDLGYRPTDVAAFSLPKEVAFSILPQTPLSKIIAQRAAQEGRPVMLHMPMQATNHKSMGPLGLSTDMFPAAIIHTLRKAIKSVPNAIGVNNHMGSAFTGQEDGMKALMEEIKRQGLFFVDSRTTVLTKAQEVAERVGVPNASRQIFLDHQRNPEFFKRQFERMKNIATDKGHVVVIGHPHPETIDFLKQHLPSLETEGFNLLSIADYFTRGDQHDQLFATYPTDSVTSSPNE